MLLASESFNFFTSSHRAAPFFSSQSLFVCHLSVLQVVTLHNLLLKSQFMISMYPLCPRLTLPVVFEHQFDIVNH